MDLDKRRSEFAKIALKKSGVHIAKLLRTLGKKFADQCEKAAYAYEHPEAFDNLGQLQQVVSARLTAALVSEVLVEAVHVALESHHPAARPGACLCARIAAYTIEENNRQVNELNKILEEADRNVRNVSCD